jgi:phage regulator Rha-like protein
MSVPILRERIEQAILVIRGQRVMLDSDLAKLYGVSTKALNQGVKRNTDRFPKDFMFRLTQQEKSEVVTNCDHLSKLKFSPTMPFAFTEHGAIMVANVLNSERAVEVSIYVVRAFVKLREMLRTHKALAQKLAELERQVESHDSHIRSLFEAIRQLMEFSPPEIRAVFPARPVLVAQPPAFVLHPGIAWNNSEFITENSLLVLQVSTQVSLRTPSASTLTFPIASTL